MILEIRPTNPQISAREFISLSQVTRIWLVDGIWSGILADGNAVVFAHPEQMDMLANWQGGA